jgi:modulator of FtsH protease HflC
MKEATMSKIPILKIVVFLVLLIVGGQSFFIVTETEQALVLQFGNPQRTVKEPGLHFKLPIVQQVLYLDDRILNLNVAEQEVIASDQKRLVVDAIGRFRIVDPLLTYQTQISINRARSQLGTLLRSNVRQVLGNQTFLTLLSGARVELMEDIRVAMNREAVAWGIEMVDVRIRRADLPEANSRAIYDRMNTERQREAREARALGQEQAVRIRAEAERERTVLLANAERQAAITRGEGDGTAVRIFAEAYGQDEEFFEFYRTMQAYRLSLGNEDTTLVMSPNSEFFKYFEGLLVDHN